MRIIIISNRLPVKLIEDNNEYLFVRSEGGLTTGLNSIDSKMEIQWVGWPGLYIDNETDKETVKEELSTNSFHPVFLSEEQILEYYEGYSNGTIWPLCHYFYSFISYEDKFWNAYQEVNRLFCEVASTIIKPDDVVWVQDYQLMLLPAMLRERFPNIAIGYFHHIPFPSYELFRVLPERAEILKGLMGADLIGFHTHDYMRHFISAAYRVLGMDFQLDEIIYQNRKILVDSFPMGINFDLHYNAPLNKKVKAIAKKLRNQFGHHSLVLSVDRLDYSKGILHRIKAFESFLENHKEYITKISLVMVVVPSRDNVNVYNDLKGEIDKMIGRINGKYSTLDWTPIYYFYRSFPFDDLMALYHIADIALITPLRDGMNLVAKEYIAAKRDEPGVLILSEMAGASIELKEALLINPNNIQEIEDALLEAMEMPLEEKEERLKKMQKTIAKQTVNKWTLDFITELQKEKIKTENIFLKQLNKTISQDIKKQYLKAKNRLIILDYDGTLAPLVKNPLKASPSKELISILKDLSRDPGNKVVINSGRDTDILDKWLGELNISMAAEHGAFFKENGQWHKNIKEKPQFSPEIYEIFEHITEKTPGSNIEEKKMSLVWHFRNSDAWLAELRQNQLINALMMPCSRLDLQIMKGNKIVEIKPHGINKGVEIERLLSLDNYDFILAMGDDVTDEDMFYSLPESAITIKIGGNSEVAKYTMISPAETLKFLGNLIK